MGDIMSARGLQTVVIARGLVSGEHNWPTLSSQAIESAQCAVDHYEAYRAAYEEHGKLVCGLGARQPGEPQLMVEYLMSRGVHPDVLEVAPHAQGLYAGFLMAKQPRLIRARELDRYNPLQVVAPPGLWRRARLWGTLALGVKPDCLRLIEAPPERGLQRLGEWSLRRATNYLRHHERWGVEVDCAQKEREAEELAVHYLPGPLKRAIPR
jgi:hypothetical protein